MRKALQSKRAIDVIISLVALAMTAPVMGVVSLCIRRQLGSPVLFRQIRPGRHGRPFTFLKFRTMTDLRDHDGRLLPDVERLTPLGRCLRRYSLDELPQLVNVLRGDMSLVGPRPLLMEYLPLYTERQARRHEVAPGITGWAQIHGRNAVDFGERFVLDVWYVEHQSTLLDLAILIRTAWQVIIGQGISAGDHATMPVFTGNAESKS